MGRSLRGDIGLLVTPCHCHSKFVPLSLQPSSTFSCPLSVSVCHKLIVVSRIPQKGSEDYPTLTLGPRAAWTPNDSASGLTLWPLPHRYAMKCLDKKRIKMKQGETLALNERIMLSLVSTGVSGWPGGLAPSSLGLWNLGAASADSLSCRLPGLPVHRLHVLCIPHARQTQLHPRSHER